MRQVGRSSRDVSWDQTLSLIVTILVAVLGGCSIPVSSSGRSTASSARWIADSTTCTGASTVFGQRWPAASGDLRSEMTANFAQVHEEIRDLRTLLQNALQTRSA